MISPATFNYVQDLLSELKEYDEVIDIRYYSQPHLKAGSFILTEPEPTIFDKIKKWVKDNIFTPKWPTQRPIS
jgi:hypothetical protein